METDNKKLSVVVSPEKTERLNEKKDFWKINLKMLPYKLNFFLLECSVGAMNPFQSAFGITVLGLTAGNIAACYTALQVSLFMIKPIIGYIADYFNRLKSVIIGLCVLHLIFAFFMIIIPSTGMPGIAAAKFKDSSLNNSYCQICLYSDTIQLFTPKHYLNEETFVNVSSCLRNNEIKIMSINCSSEYIKSSKFMNNSFEFTQIIYNFSYTDSLLHEKYTSEKDMHINEVSSDVLYIKTPLLSFICLSPTENVLAFRNFSVNELNRYCFTLSNELDLKLQYSLTKADTTPINCNILKETAVSKHKDDRNLSVANFRTYQFWLFGIFLVFAATFSSSEFTMSDAAVYESIQANDYGQQRFWGPIGWGLSATLAGYLIDYTEGFIASWCLCACFSALQIWNVSRMNLVKPQFSQSILKYAKSIFSSVEFLCFAIGCFMNGIFTGILWYYLTWFILSIGGNKLTIGLVQAVQNYVGEMPAMYFSGWLIKKLGHFNLVSLALICHGIRFFLYSYIHNPWWILPIEWLQGLTFASFYAAMTSYGKLNSIPGTEATTQSILSITFEALGCGLGCVTAGICFELYGGHTTFFYASFVCIIATIINVFFTCIISCRKGSQDVTKSSAVTERY